MSDIIIRLCKHKIIELHQVKKSKGHVNVYECICALVVDNVDVLYKIGSVY